MLGIMYLCVYVCVWGGGGSFHTLMTSEINGFEWPAAHLDDFVSEVKGPLN